MNSAPPARLPTSFFSEILLLPDGTRREIVDLKRVERWLWNRDHEIALLLDAIHSVVLLQGPGGIAVEGDEADQAMQHLERMARAP